jgi:hypothetical protein
MVQSIFIENGFSVVLEDSALVGILFKPSGLPWKEEFS